jgi:hypothetical protein
MEKVLTIFKFLVANTNFVESEKFLAIISKKLARNYRGVMLNQMFEFESRYFGTSRFIIGDIGS